jgi:hypothetical protein
MFFFQDEVYIDEDDRFTSSDIVELEASSKIGMALVTRSASNPQNSSYNLVEFRVRGKRGGSAKFCQCQPRRRRAFIVASAGSSHLE